MKTARMVLTATMLLSLNATSYCSQSQQAAATAPSTDDVITAPRQNSHDGTRDGFFGSGLDTLRNLGTPYGSQRYGLGSDNKAQERWSNVGNNDIKTVTDAEKFITAVKAKGWSLPTEALAPSRILITAHYSQSKKQAEDLILVAVAKLKAHEDSEKALAQQLRNLQTQATADQTKCNELLPFDPIDNAFSRGKQLNNGNIRSFLSEKLRYQQAQTTVASASTISSVIK